MEKKTKLTIVTGTDMAFRCGIGRFKELLARTGDMDLSCLTCSPGARRDIVGEIKALHPELLVTTDLLGFEQCTLTDNISYNLLDCKQLHLLLHRDLPNEPYLDRQLSIAMFFFCAGDAYYDYLAQKYPRLPYLGKLHGWQADADGQAEDGNAEVLYAALKEVLREIQVP